MKKIGDFVTRRKFPSATEIALEQEALCAEYDDRMVERMINKGEAENRTEAVRILEFMWQELDYKSTEQIKALKKAVDKQDEELGTTEIADALRKASEQIIHVMLEYRSRESFKKMKDKIATAGILTLEEMEEIE